MNTNIVFIGGDMRMIYAAEALSARYGCYLCGLGEHRFLPQHREGSRYDIAVLPIMTGDAVKGCGVLAELLNKRPVDLGTLPLGSVVVTHDLTPSMTAGIRPGAGAQ